MSYLVIVVNSTNDTIENLNAKVVHSSGNGLEGVVALRNYMDSILIGVVDAEVQFTTRDSDPSVSTSGSGSTQATYDLK